jgi:hypothetical protein
MVTDPELILSIEPSRIPGHLDPDDRPPPREKASPLDHNVRDALDHRPRLHHRPGRILWHGTPQEIVADETRLRYGRDFTLIVAAKRLEQRQVQKLILAPALQAIKLLPSRT